MVYQRTLIYEDNRKDDMKMYKSKAYDMIEKKVQDMKTGGVQSMTINEVVSLLSETRTEAYNKFPSVTGEEMAHILTDFVNGATNGKLEKFVETLTRRSHRTLQEEVFMLFLKCVDSWAEQNQNVMYDYDARNKYTIITSDKIKRFLENV